MTIKSLRTLCQKHGGDRWLTVVHLEDFAGTRVGIDISCIIHALWSVEHSRWVQSRPTMEDLFVAPTEQEVKIMEDRVIVGAIDFFHSTFLTDGVEPLIIFDGQRPPRKAEHAGKRRAKDRAAAERRLAEKHAEVLATTPLERDEGIKKVYELKKQVFEIPPTLNERLRETLSNLGLVAIKCPVEADTGLGALYRDGIISAAYSGDCDLSVWGVERVLAGLLGAKRPKLGAKVAEMNANMSLSQRKTATLSPPLELNREQFMQMCIAAECDYNTGVPKYAIMSAYKDVKSHGNLLDLSKKGGRLEKVDMLECLHEFRPRSCDELWPEGVGNISLEVFAINGMKTLNSLGIGQRFAAFRDVLASCQKRKSQIASEFGVDHASPAPEMKMTIAPSPRSGSKDEEWIPTPDSVPTQRKGKYALSSTNSQASFARHAPTSLSTSVVNKGKKKRMLEDEQEGDIGEKPYHNPNKTLRLNENDHFTSGHNDEEGVSMSENALVPDDD